MLFPPAQQTKQITTWSEYWGEEALWPYPELFQVNAKLFCKYLPEFLPLKASDRILNIGCGPGWIEKELANQVSWIRAVDTSERFVSECSERTKDCVNVAVNSLGHDFTDISFFGETYSVFLCVSVVQYYENFQAIERLIQSAQSCAAPGAKMLIADMPLRRKGPGNFYDYSCSLVQSVREGYASIFIRKMLKEWRKIRDYYQYCQKLKHLDFTREDLRGIGQRLGLKTTIFSAPFSFCSNRLSLLIEF